ncbi:Hypothetical protein SRAE_X000079500 [Strongyloides ratti]|uniref:C2H2-type domain-containing protein n=1 Tax=Strongyloides ratti TaxID=34506 RepID=A0A090LNM4_STRRB|nr:Hypothetical protein SRAE_X000079500 [Strongyloides ratti]CEF71470.1 Hypothetical protein SRAE_X000079500 [Strongyloides ratti]
MAKFNVEEKVMSSYNEQIKKTIINIKNEIAQDINDNQECNKNEKEQESPESKDIITKVMTKISPKESPKMSINKTSSVSPNKGKRFRCTLTMVEGPITDVHNHIKRALWQRFGINRYSCNIGECNYGGYNLKAIINHQYIIHNISDTSKANIRDIFEQHKELYLSFKKQFIVIE